MNASKIQLSIAAAALAAAGAVVAQGTPPNPNVANPALGAGQQTQQGTSMGTTGVPTPAPGGTTGTMQQAPATSSGTAVAPATPSAPPSTNMDAPMRPARADRG
ncbi:proteophosphoglycan ppg4 [Xenophilus sp. Marseille-Q4582]|uniref:proteophosphoglycan ppg4 n=1 Tax=Xenophilus sp. Marseille-Q4582 TaxID=2866600 RepID=UPI001CE4A2A2|nr:proteophosphoglycan ppg4 [Xenophilus sp. Marseille-Q4582]